MAISRFQKMVSEHINNASGLPAINYRPIIKAQGVELTVFKMLSIIHTSDFVRTVGTITQITVALPFSQKRIIATTANGDISVRLQLISGGRVRATEKYKGIVVSNRNTDMESPTMFLGQSDEKSVSYVTLELMEESVWYLRLKQMGGIFYGSDPLSVAKNLLTEAVKQETQDGQMLLCCDDEEQQPYREIVIPDGTDFLGLFDYIQKHYGIYSKGLGLFNYMNVWHMFMPWDSAKFNRAKNKLVIFNLPKERSAHLDRTIQMGNTLSYIITGGNAVSMDNRDQNALNKGTGYRVASVRVLDGRASSFSPGEISKTTPNAFVSAANPAPYAGGVTNARIDRSRAFADTDKPQRSDLAQTLGTIIKVTWNRAAYGIVQPGMAVKFMYANEYEIYTRYGTVIGEVFQAAVDGDSLATDRYNSQSELTLWLSNEKITE